MDQCRYLMILHITVFLALPSAKMTGDYYSTIRSKESVQSKEITKTFITGQNSCTLVIPKSVAMEYRLTSPSHVVVERVEEGILIRKLKVEF